MKTRFFLILIVYIIVIFLQVFVISFINLQIRILMLNSFIRKLILCILKIFILINSFKNFYKNFYIHLFLFRSKKLRKIKSLYFICSTKYYEITKKKSIKLFIFIMFFLCSSIFKDLIIISHPT